MNKLDKMLSKSRSSNLPNTVTGASLNLFISRPLLRFWTSSSPQLQSPNESEPLISSVVSILKEQRSKSRWNFIKTLHPDGFTPNQVSEITLRIRNNPRLALRFFLWSERKSLCIHNLYSYSTIIHILSRSRLKTLAQTLIRTAIRVTEAANDAHPLSMPPKIFETLTKTYRYCDSAPFVFDLLIRACLQSKRIDSAIEIVRMLRSKGIYPTIGTCNLLIRSVSQLRGSDACLSIYREIFSLDEDIDIKVRARARAFPNIQTFNALMLAFYQDGLMGKVEEIWTEMVDGCYPNVYSYSVLLAAICDQGKVDEAIRVWKEMRIKKIKPDIMAYNTLIKGVCGNRDMEKAEEIFREMALDKIEATCVTFEHLIKGYCEVGDVDSAISLYKDLCRTKEFRPEVLTVEEVIRVMCDQNRTSDALKFLRDATKRHDISPSGTSYEFLIRGLCEEERMEEALKLQIEMVGKGFAPNKEIYDIFIYGYNKAGDDEKTVNLRKEMSKFGLQYGSEDPACGTEEK